MFGTLRYAMAFIVVLAHLWPNHAPWAAHYAVFAFYMISGFLITRILREVYPYTPKGIGLFALNRFLRLYPAYVIVLVATLIVIRYAPGPALNVSAASQWPHGFKQWWANVTIFGLAHWKIQGLNSISPLRVVNNGWSLSIEVWMYALMALGLARHRLIIAAWLAAGVGFAMYGFMHHFEFFDRYLPVPSGLLPFAIGAVLYEIHKRWNVPPRYTALWCALSLSAWLILCVISSNDGAALIDSRGSGLYLSLLPMAFLVLGLISLPSALRNAYGRMDYQMGRFSYPIFLCHWTCGVVMKWQFPALDSDNGTLLLASLPAIHVAAWLVLIVSEKPLLRLRAQVRSHAIKHEPTPASAIVANAA